MGQFSSNNNVRNEKEPIMTREVPFAVEEAYNSLRTNLIFSLPEEKSKLIEITSSTQNEGKSITAVNLSIALAKNGESVLLIDCDLRLPTVAKKLRVRQKPGLTNLLFGQNSMEDVIIHHPTGLDIITAGALPPNPSEVLGSSKMSAVLEQLKQQYDYVILDVPPVGVVTDAAVLAPKVSGILLVVRQGIARHEGINAAINQLQLANGNVIGFVMTGAKVAKKGYFRYRYGAYSKAAKIASKQK